MILTEVNFVSILIGALATYLLGWFWYSPKVFGHEWIRGLGYRSEEISVQWYHFVGGFLVAFVTAWIFAGLINYFEIDEIKEGVQLGFWIWLGFIATTCFSGYLWERKTFNVYLINIGYHLVALLFLGAFLTYWS